MATMALDTSDKVKRHFMNTMEEDSDVSAAIAAIKTLLEVIRTVNDIKTASELNSKLQEAVAVIKTSDVSVTSITSGCDLFQRFITNIRSDKRDQDFEQLKEVLLERGDKFVTKVQSSRKRIAELGSFHIKDNAKILIHSRSRVVLELLSTAAKSKHFKVYVTQSLPDKLGEKMVTDLKKLNISVTCILDAAVGYIMEKVDLVLVGAEGVLASGGIINKVGTYAIALAAHAHSKPVYVVAESFKFSPLYPLNQQDVPNEYKYNSTTLTKASGKLENEHPLVDYTPPKYITLLFTDIGILTPTAVSDELIKLS